MPGFVIAQPSGFQIAPSGIADSMQLATAALNAGFPAKDVPMAVAIALAESRGRVAAANHNRNGTVDHGAWQINDVNLHLVGYSGTQLEENLQDNANAAYKVWLANGKSFRPWTTFTSGAYKKFLGQGRNGLKQSQAAGNWGAPVTDVGNAVSSVANTISDTAGALGSIATLLTSAEFWIRLGEAILGVVLIVIGLKTVAGVGA